MNNTWFFAGSPEWIWLSGGAGLVLAGLIAWLELRKKRTNIGLRILLSWLAIGALLLAAWQPAYRQSLPLGQAALLTENAPEEGLDSLKERYPGLQVFHLEKGGEGTYLPHPLHLQAALAPGSKLFLLGNGLPGQALNYLQEYRLQHLPGPAIEGLETLSFPRHLFVGDTFRLSGNWEQPSDSLLIKLSLAGKPVDSAFVYPESTGFSLQHISGLGGELHYQLRVEDRQKQTLEQLPLVVAVQENRPLRLALFTAYPTFESKNLKNWLGQQGHALFYQAEMAPDRYVREWINLPDKTGGGLNKKLLGEVDILLLDQGYFTGLPATTHQLIESAVEEGMGLLLLTDGSSLSSEGDSWENLPPLRLNGRARAERLTAGTHTEGGVLLPLYEAHSPGWYGREENAGLRYIPYGLGRVGLSLAEETYSLRLKDRESAYERQWSYLLNKMAPANQPPPLLGAEFPAFAGQPQQLTVWQAEKEAPELVLAEPNGRKLVLPLIQDSRLPERWFAYYWPGQDGLHELILAGRDSLSFQVLEADALPAFQVRQKAVHLQDYRRNVKEAEGLAQTSSLNLQEHRIPLYWMYLLFLLCLSGLWVERKLNTP